MSKVTKIRTRGSIFAVAIHVKSDSTDKIYTFRFVAIAKSPDDAIAIVKRGAFVRSMVDRIVGSKAIFCSFGELEDVYAYAGSDSDPIQEEEAA